MKRTVNIFIFCCASIAALALPASRADANPAGAGYVCKLITYQASAMPAYGAHGFITVNFTSAPDCKGRYLWHGYIYSRGARSRWAHADYLLGKDGLQWTANFLRLASVVQQRVSWKSCPGKQFCISGYSIKAAGERSAAKQAEGLRWGQTIRRAFARLIQGLSVVRL